MRALLLAFALALPALAGCVSPAPAAVDDEPLEENAAPSPPPLREPAPEAPRPEPAAPESPVVVLPDPCAEPVHGLDHPCIADGFHFGETVFWDGGAVPGLRETGTPETCARTGACRDVTFDVAATAPGARLRIDVQVFFRDPSHVRALPDSSPTWGHETALDVLLFPPGVAPAPGAEIASASTWGSFAASLVVGGYDFEAREALPGPEEGTWTLRVHGLLPDDLDHRLRARLDAPTPPTDEIAYPDLVIVPPFEVGFMAPSSSFQPGAPTRVAVPFGGCMPEEYLEAHRNGMERPTLCLRFSMGFGNAAAGSFRLKMTESPTAGPTESLEEGPPLPVVQSVCTADLRLCRDLPRPEALVARWDPNHGHYHYQNAYVFDLYRVHAASDGARRPELTFVATSGKLGIDPAGETLLGWWTAYHQGAPWAPRGTDASGAEDRADKHVPAGWADIYDWNRAGNYVPFPADATLRPVPGEYVLRGATDPDGHIVEEDEGNNRGYTWFRVDATGAVDILERGDGLDPWDPAKSVLDVTP